MKGKAEGRIAAFWRSLVVIILILSFGIFSNAPAGSADDYDPQEAGHPLKLVAYMAFPIGTLLDYGLMRPAFWVVQKEPFRTIFGYNYMEQSDQNVHQDAAEEMLEE
jgi:hypothetical protein